MTDTDLADAIEIAGMVRPARSYPGTGALWFGRNEGLADATFTDWGLARAVATIINAVNDGRLVPAAAREP
jgi:hypothetical protein